MTVRLAMTGYSYTRVDAPSGEQQHSPSTEGHEKENHALTPAVKVPCGVLGVRRQVRDAYFVPYKPPGIDVGAEIVRKNYLLPFSGVESHNRGIRSAALVIIS